MRNIKIFFQQLMYNIPLTRLSPEKKLRNLKGKYIQNACKEDQSFVHEHRNIKNLDLNAECKKSFKTFYSTMSNKCDLKELHCLKLNDFIEVTLKYHEIMKKDITKSSIAEIKNDCGEKCDVK